MSDSAVVLLDVAAAIVRKALPISVEPVRRGQHVATPDDVPLARLWVTEAKADTRAGTLSGVAHVVVYALPGDATYGMALAKLPESIWAKVTEPRNRWRLRPQRLTSGEVGSGEVRANGRSTFSGLVAAEYQLHLVGVVPKVPIISSAASPMATQSLKAAVAGALRNRIGDAVRVDAGAIATREASGLRTSSVTVGVALQGSNPYRNAAGVPYGEHGGVSLSTAVESLPGIFMPNVGRVVSVVNQGYSAGALRVVLTLESRAA